MNNQTIYKRTKINWWAILIFGGIYVWTIFAYIHQWGNRPIDEIGLIIFTALWFPFLIFLWRFQLVIDNNYIMYRMGIWTIKKIPIEKIRKVDIEKGFFFSPMKFKGYSIQNYSLGFAKQTVFVYSRNDIIYTITTKNAQEIKDEIEKRMTK